MASSSSEPVSLTTKSADRSTNCLWPLGILALLIGMVYGSALLRLAQDWLHDPNYSHGFLIAPFSAFLVWRRRGELRRLPVQPSWWGLPAIGLALGIFVVGKLGAELFLTRSSFVFLLGGLVVYLLGWRWLRVVLFPLAFLFLMIPIPALVFDQISLPLQFFASRLASGLLTLVGVPVLREGNIIQLPAMALEVAEACSGIRSLVSLVALAIIYGYFLEPTLWRRVVLAVAAVPIAVIANSARIMGTGLLVEYWSPEAGQGFFHEFSGWLIFVLALCLLFAFHSCLHLKPIRRSHA